MAITHVVIVLSIVASAFGQMLLTSPHFPNFGAIPPQFGCDVDERDGYRPNPSLKWLRSPVNAQSFIVMMDDVTEGGKVHWLVTDIPGDVHSLDEDVSETKLPPGASELKNAFNQTNYEGPCPLNDTHAYRFRVFAMPTAKTAIDDSGNKTATADAVTDQLGDRPLYVAVLTANFKLGLPKITKEPIKVYTINITQHGYLRVWGDKHENCVWTLKRSDDVMIDLLRTTISDLKGKPHDLFEFEGLQLGITQLLFQYHCLDDIEDPRSVIVDVRILPPANRTYDLVISMYPQPPQSPPRHYVKPSEVLANAHKRPHNVLLSPEPICRSRGGQSECVVDQQLLESSGGENANGTWNCVARLRNTRSSRLSDGSFCGMRVRVGDVKCDNFVFPSHFQCQNGISPGLEWLNVPQHTKSLVILMTSTEIKHTLQRAGPGNSSDVRRDQTVAWLVTDVNPSFSSIVNGASQSNRMPPLSIEQRNGFGNLAYAPPCFAPQHTQTMQIQLYAMPHEHTPLHNTLSHPSVLAPNGFVNVPEVENIQQQLRRDALCVSTVDLPLVTAQ